MFPGCWEDSESWPESGVIFSNNFQNLWKIRKFTSGQSIRPTGRQTGMCTFFVKVSENIAPTVLLVPTTCVCMYVYTCEYGCTCVCAHTYMEARVNLVRQQLSACESRHLWVSNSACQIACTRNIYITIYNGSRTTAMGSNGNNLMVGGRHDVRDCIKGS